MLTLLWVLLAGYGIGILLPLCLRRRKAQGLAAGIAAITATIAGIALGLWGLTASEPLAASIPSTIPLLTFAIRLDALAAFFVLTISLAGLSAVIYAIGYVGHFE